MTRTLTCVFSIASIKICFLPKKGKDFGVNYFVQERRRNYNTTMKKNVYDYPVHQYQQNEQPPLILTDVTEHEKGPRYMTLEI